MTRPMVVLEPVPDMTVTKTLFNLATAAAALVLAGVMITAIRLASRYRTPIPLLFILGGALTYGYEPIVDTLGKCWLPSGYQVTVFRMLDRPMPLYGLFVYMAFFGGFTLTSWSQLMAGAEPNAIWRTWGYAIFINTFLFETPAVPIFHIYIYYGIQPFDLWGFPLWWPFVNTTGPLCAGIIIYLLQKHFQVEKKLLLLLSVILVPMSNGAVNGAAAYPTWVSLHTNVPVGVVYLAGAVTVGLATMILHGVIKAANFVQKQIPISSPSSPERSPLIST